ncbi:MAG: hemolysin family protein [Candidatus Hodarchaeota archaeon]
MGEILIILFLVIINGLLAGTEIAVLSARRPLLLSQAKTGDKGAQSVLSLLDTPNAFLSTIQVGITLVGILAGAFGGADAVHYLVPRLATLPIPGIAIYAEPIAIGIVVLGITYLALVIGELVPKRLALQRPESISKAMARPMGYLAAVTRPVVWLLSTSTDAVLRLLGVKDKKRPSVTEEEIKYLVAEGARTGVFVPAEKKFLDRIFRFADQAVVDVMRPRPDIVALDVREPPTVIKERILNSGYSRFPVYRGDLDNIMGVVHAKDLLAHEEPLDLETLVREVLFVPETQSLLGMLQSFQTTRGHLAIVIDEFGATEGLITLEDVLEEIVGEIRDEYDREEPSVLQREDGSLLADGSLSLADLKEILKVEHLAGEDSHQFHTLGGFMMAQLRHVPREGDQVEWSGYRFEVLDMDGLRVDKVLIRSTSPDGSG